MISKTLTSIESQLKDIGYTDDMPMAIKATEHYQIKNEQELVESVKQQVVLNEKRDLLSAAAQKFPLVGREGFELVIDDDFLFQQRGVVLHHCKNFKIIFSDVNQQIHKEAKFLIEIQECQHFIIEHLDVIGGRNIIAVSESKDFHIRECRIEKAEGYAVIVHHCTRFHITKSVFKKNLASGVMVLGASSQGLISQCRCEDTTGYFNFDAAIHLCALSETVEFTDIPEKCHGAFSILQKVHRPFGIVIENCVLKGARAQGIYLEGAINCLIRNNILTKNNKEGICFDWGSCYNIFKRNDVSFNGNRSNLSKEEILADFIDKYPVLKDGSSSAKLAGISLDNGCMNQIVDNKITKNYGGGIKFVRSSFFNEVKGNLIAFNVRGRNRFMPFCYGISAPEPRPGAIDREFKDKKAALLDLLPSQLNTFLQNIIRGQLKESIHTGEKSTCNLSIDNVTRFYYAAWFMCSFYFRKIWDA